MTDLPDEDTIRVQRSGAAREVPASGRHRETFVDADGDEQTDGSTIIARRESRRRAAREQAGAAAAGSAVADRTPPTAEAAPVGRVAAVPDPGAGIRYGVRGANPVVVPRAAPSLRRAQEPVDAVRTDAARRRRARRIALAAVIAASAIALGAAVALALVLLGA